MSRSIRVLISVVVITVTVAAALWIAGSQRMRYSTSLLIDAPPSEVFAYLTDADLMKQWVDGLVEVEPVTDNPNQIGAKARVVMESGGKRIVYDDEVIRYQEDSQLTIKAQNSLITLTSIYQLEPKEGDKTYLTYVVKTAHHGLGKFLAPLFSNPIEEKITSDAQRLKQLVETTSGESKPSTTSPSNLNQTETVTSGSTDGSQ